MWVAHVPCLPSLQGGILLEETPGPRDLGDLEETSVTPHPRLYHCPPSQPSAALTLATVNHRAVGMPR